MTCLFYGADRVRHLCSSLTCFRMKGAGYLGRMCRRDLFVRCSLCDQRGRGQGVKGTHAQTRLSLGICGLQLFSILLSGGGRGWAQLPQKHL